MLEWLMFESFWMSLFVDFGVLVKSQDLGVEYVLDFTRGDRDVAILSAFFSAFHTFRSSDIA